MTTFAWLGMAAMMAVAAPTRADEGPAAPSRGCATRDYPGDRRDVACTLEPSPEARIVRFAVHLTGGHDDTRASMQATLDGKPACATGSKVALFGEEGDVSLECRIERPAGSAAGVLRVVVVWTCAAFARHELR